MREAGGGGGEGGREKGMGYLNANFIAASQKQMPSQWHPWA